MKEAAPPFDIQDIPGAMRRELMPVSAKLMERWFAGELNYSRTDADEKAEINQDGNPYPASMYDTTSIKLDWVLNFQRAKNRYDELLTSLIKTPNAISELRKILLRYRQPYLTLDTWQGAATHWRGCINNFSFSMSVLAARSGRRSATFWKPMLITMAYPLI